jgi:hypothetical protein
MTDKEIIQNIQVVFDAAIGAGLCKNTAQAKKMGETLDALKQRLQQVAPPPPTETMPGL